MIPTRQTNTGFVLGQNEVPTYWQPKDLVARYEKQLSALKNKLKLQEKAGQDAQEDLQKNECKNRVSWTGTENEIVNSCQGALDGELNTLRQELTIYQTRIDENKTTPEQVEVALRLNEEVLIATVQDKLKNNQDEVGNSIFQLIKTKNQRQANFQFFRAKNNLKDRTAEYPNSKLWSWFIILLILFIEIAVNSAFFAKGSELGLLGGFFQASVFAIMNIGFACFFVFCFKYIFHVEYTWKTLGSIGACFSISMMVFVALIACRFRLDAASAIDLTAAISSLKFTDLIQALLTKDGLLLAAITAFMSLIAIIDFYKMDDPYPNYGKKQREIEKFKRELAKQSTQFIDKATAVNVEDIKTKASKIYNQLSIVTNNYTNIMKIFDGYNNDVIVSLQNGYCSLIYEYREAYKYVSNGSSVVVTKNYPPHFDAKIPELVYNDLFSSVNMDYVKLNGSTAEQAMEKYKMLWQEIQTKQYESKIRRTIANAYGGELGNIETSTGEEIKRERID